MTRRFPGLSTLLPLLLLGALAGLGLAADQKSEKSLLEQLEALERDVEAANREIGELTARREQIDRELADSSGEAERLRRELDARKERLALRLRTAYKLSQGSSWEYLLASRDFGDYVLRRYYLARLWSRDRELVEAYHSHLAHMDENALTAAERSRELDGLLEAQQRHKATLTRRLEEARAFVERVRKDAALKARGERETSRARETISKDIKELKSPEAGGGFARLKGKLRCPAAGVVTSGFGEIGEGADRRFHGGLDITAREGSPILAPASGKIVFSGRFRGFGNLVILDHGDGYFSLYGHLRELMQAEGANLKSGELLGHVGATGSLKGSMLYFELRHKGKPINPDEWVRCR